MDISKRAMLVALKMTTWSCSRVDKEITEDVRMKAQAQHDIGRYNKRLLAKTAMQEIKQIDGEARNTNYAMTLPWAQDGSRILAAPQFTKWDAEMRRLKSLREMAIRNFADNYDALVDDARASHGGLFKAEDYPAIDKVLQKFTWDLVVMPMPTGADFRVDMSKEMAAHLQADIERRTMEQVQASMKDVFGRVAKVVGHMAESLKDYKIVPGKDGKDIKLNPFRDTLVSNVRDLADLLPGLNLTADPALAKITTKIIANLTEATADQLRDDPKLRGKVAKQAAAILKDMEDYL